MLIILIAVENKIINVYVFPRYNKRIILDDGTAVNYDMLFLFCGAQYPRTPALKNAPMELQPRNVFYINTETDAAIALRTLEVCLGTPVFS